jgi:type I restriction enzyme S subunit
MSTQTQNPATTPKTKNTNHLSEWKEYKLTDLCELIVGGTPKTSVPEYWNGNIPWLSVTDFNTGRKYCFDAEKKITEKGLKESSTKILKKGQIIISARGTVGVISVLGNDMAFNQSNYGINAKDGLTSNDFLYYLLKDNLSQFISNSYGAVFDTITKQTFEQIIVELPPLPEQSAIAEVLSSLDDKIDLLHRQNKTLEQLAETLFRQWFVPARAGEPHAGGEEAKESWEVGKLGDIAEVQNGFAFSSRDYVEYQKGHLEVLKMGHIQKGGGLRPDPKRDYVPRTEKLSRWVLNKGDIIMAMTDMKDNVVILGVPAMIDKSDNYVLNQRVARIYLKDKTKLLSNYLLYIQLKDTEFIQVLQSKANSGVQVNLSTETIKDCDIILPPIELQKEKVSTIENLYFKVEENQSQIRTLTALRDTLLPKLMSGEIRLNYDF